MEAVTLSSYCLGFSDTPYSHLPVPVGSFTPNSTSVLILWHCQAAMTQKADDLGVKILLFCQSPIPMQWSRGSFPCHLKCLCVREEHTYKRRSDKDVINTPRKGCSCQMGVQILPDSRNTCVYILKETHMESYNSISNTYIWKQQRDMEPSTHFFLLFLLMFSSASEKGRKVWTQEGREGRRSKW